MTCNDAAEINRKLTCIIQKLRVLVKSLKVSHKLNRDTTIFIYLFVYFWLSWPAGDRSNVNVSLSGESTMWIHCDRARHNTVWFVCVCVCVCVSVCVSLELATIVLIVC